MNLYMQGPFFLEGLDVSLVKTPKNIVKKYPSKVLLLSAKTKIDEPRQEK